MLVSCQIIPDPKAGWPPWVDLAVQREPKWNGFTQVMTYTGSKSKISTVPAPCIPIPVEGHQTRGSSGSLAEQPTLNYHQAVLWTDTGACSCILQGRRKHGGREMESPVLN